MSVTIVGAQLGDEGKGKVTDLYSETADIVVRFQGGNNAGHTVVVEGKEFKLHHVPSGAVRGREKTAVIGNGCVVNPGVLLEEIESLEREGIKPDVRIAERAHVIMPYHEVLDGIEEEAKDDMAAGTTGRGIGPTYEDKAARRGVRTLDLLKPDALRDKLEYVVPKKRALVEDVYGIELDEREEMFDIDAVHEEYVEYGKTLEENVINASKFINQKLDQGEEVLFEGAQGTSLDIDHGVYPYLTSSNTTIGGACTGAGVGATRMKETVGIMKAYLSRVGPGPLPTELENEIGDHLVEVGDEYGTTTGRRRRVGWFDLPMVRHATRINDFTGTVMTSIDVLEGLEEVKLCVAYEVGDTGEEIYTMPADMDRWGRCEPVYETFEGWHDVNWDAVEGYDDIPENARDYLEYIEEDLNTSLYAVSVGPDREQTIIRRNPFDKS